MQRINKAMSSTSHTQNKAATQSSPKLQSKGITHRDAAPSPAAAATAAAAAADQRCPQARQDGCIARDGIPSQAAAAAAAFAAAETTPCLLASADRCVSGR